MIEGEDPGCRLCHKRRGEHAALEEQKVLNHVYTETGDLTAVERSPKKKERPPREVMVVPGADLLVRQLLIQKGILNEADFSDAGALGHRSAEDVSDRAEKTSE